MDLNEALEQLENHKTKLVNDIQALESEKKRCEGDIDIYRKDRVLRIADLKKRYDEEESALSTQLDPLRAKVKVLHEKIADSESRYKEVITRRESELDNLVQKKQWELKQATDLALAAKATVDVIRGNLTVLRSLLKEVQL